MNKCDTDSYLDLITKMNDLSRSLRQGLAHGLSENLLDNIVYDMARDSEPHECEIVLFHGIRFRMDIFTSRTLHEIILDNHGVDIFATSRYKIPEHF